MPNITHILTELITNIFEKNGNKPLNYKQVAAKLNVVDPESKKSILSILKNDTRDGIFIENGKGKYQLKETKTFLTGIIDLSNDGSAYLVPDDSLEKDIYIAPRKLRRALNGDHVKIYVYASKKGKRKEGEVVEILRRAKFEFTGIVKVSQHYAFFIPDDRKMLHDIFIPLEDLNGAKNRRKSSSENCRLA